MIPWKTLASIPTAEGELQLRQHGEREFVITIDRRVLMSSRERTSELAVATLACEALAGRKVPRVLIGGLGLGYTLRAALDALPAAARITVAELTGAVAEWCRGPLAPLTDGAVLDRRVNVVIGDVASVIARARPGSYDAIIFDLYEGPHGPARHDADPFYGRAALARQHAALSTGGVLSVWSEAENLPYKRRMEDAGFATKVHHPGGSRSYVVYLGRRGEAPEASAPRARGAPRNSPDRRSQKPRR
jgi:spermidine synthase